MKTVARKFPKKLEREGKKHEQNGTEDGGHKNARNEEEEESIRPHHMCKTTSTKHFGWRRVCIQFEKLVGVQRQHDEVEAHRVYENNGEYCVVCLSNNTSTINPLSFQLDT